MMVINLSLIGPKNVAFHGSIRVCSMDFPSIWGMRFYWSESKKFYWLSHAYKTDTIDLGNLCYWLIIFLT